MSRQVLFIRHAMPAVDKTVSSRSWRLSDGGRQAAQNLAERLQLPESIYVVSSDEVKARETAEVFSDLITVDSRVQEVSRPWTEGDYKSIARDWLSSEPIEDWEPRDAVLARMGETVNEALQNAEGPVIVVTHGMAMSAYIARVAQVDPVSFWSDLGFPDARLLDLDNGRVDVPAELSERRVRTADKKSA